LALNIGRTLPILSFDGKEPSLMLSLKIYANDGAMQCVPLIELYV
jgi:hypothetical protein